MTPAAALLSLWICWLTLLNWGHFRLKKRWKKQMQFHLAQPSPTISWLIPFRNEVSNVRRFIAYLNPNRHPFFVWINDSSADSGPIEIAQTKAVLIQNTGIGKKEALIAGWQHSISEWNIHTDADVEWTEKSMAHWEDALSRVSDQTILVAGLPTLEGNTFDAEDFRANLFAASGMAGWGLPFLCSGAALAVRSNRLSKPLRPWLGPSSSGDDVFLLHNVVAHFGSSAVVTLPCPELKVKGAVNLAKAIQQRMRWAGKSILFRNPAAISVSLFIYSFHAAGLVFLCLPGNPSQKLILVGAKALADALLSGGKPNRILHRLVLSMAYWLYIPLLPALAWITMPLREAKKVW
jgi:hypothetical protein